MTAEELLAYLRQQGIELWVEADRLRYRGLRQTLPPALVTLLRKHKLALHQLLRDERIQGMIPLSQQQRAFWFLQELTPDSLAYVGVVALRFEAPVVPAALQGAIDRLVQRHSLLRTRFELRDGVPWQRVEANAPLRLQIIDVHDRPDPEIDVLVRREAQRPPALLSDPPVRVVLFQLPRAHSVLLLCIHHIYVDGWSIGILLKELGAFYRQTVSNRPEVLAAPAMRFEEYVTWQQQLLLSPTGEEHEQFFRRSLSGDLPVLDLPADLPRPSLRHERGASVAFTLPAAQLAELRQFSYQHNVTPYTTLLAVFAVFLSRYSGQTDLLIGTPYHGRSEPRFNDLVGCLINTLVLRIQLDPTTPFLQSLPPLHQTVTDSVRHGDYPITRVMQWAEARRDASRMPLFQVLFTYENFVGADVVASVLADEQAASATADRDLFGVPMRPLPLPQMEGQFELGLMVIETQQALRVSLSYSTDLFLPSTAERMATQLQRLLRHALTAPMTPLRDLDLLSPDERSQLLRQGCPPGPTIPPGLTVGARFVQQAAATPDRLAVVCADQALTYRELDQKTAALAAALRARGIGRGDCVGVLLHRSCSLVAALFGIMRAGAAYVPLDPALPSARLHFILADTACRLVVTQPSLRSLLPDDVPDVLFVDALPEHDPRTPPAAPVPEVLDDAQAAPAYIIYTSGSTGQPRGVVITHRPLIHLWLTMAQDLYAPSRLIDDGEDRPLRVASLSPMSFDASVEALLQLLSGHTLVLPTDAQRESIVELVQLFRQHRIDIIESPTSLLSAFFDAGLFSSPEYRPRQISFGGEAVPATVWKKMQTMPWVDFVNTYGPTESTVFSISERVGHYSDQPYIGKPLPGCCIYIVDPQDRLVPVGMRGEICIGGECVGTGYLNQPERTAARFVADPFSSRPQARMYRSGDLGRWLPDGNIEYLGRSDTQVKLRGFRIELGEIESVLRSHPSVGDVVVELHSPQTERACLVAYVAIPDRGGAAPTSDELRTLALARLPAYMVPSVFVFVERVPRKASGKVNRHLLPPVQFSPSNKDANYGQPLDWLEVELLSIWESLLEARPISREDSFFALGGHSLLAMRMMSQIHSRFGVLLPIHSLFGAGTIAALSAEIRKALASSSAGQGRAGAAESAVALRSRGASQRLFLLPAAGAHVLAYRELALLLPESIDVYALADDAAVPPSGETSLQALAQAHLTTLRRLQPHGPYLLAGWSMGGVLAFEAARQLQQAGEEVAFVALIDSVCPSAIPESQRQPVGQDREQFLQSLGLSDRELPPFWAATFERYQQHARLFWQYPALDYAGPVLLLLGVDNSVDALPSDVRADYGWGRVCKGTLTVLPVSGEHHGLLRAPAVQAVAQGLTRGMTAVLSTLGGQPSSSNRAPERDS